MRKSVLFLAPLVSLYTTAFANGSRVPDGRASGMAIYCIEESNRDTRIDTEFVLARYKANNGEMSDRIMFIRWGFVEDMGPVPNRSILYKAEGDVSTTSNPERVRFSAIDRSTGNRFTAFVRKHDLLFKEVFPVAISIEGTSVELNCKSYDLRAVKDVIIATEEK